MVNFRPIIVNVLIAILFILAVIMGGSMMAISNHANQSILDDPTFVKLKLNLSSDLAKNSLNSKEALNSFENSSIKLTSGIPFLDSVYGTWKVIKSTPTIMYNLVSAVIFQNLLGSETSAIILSVIGAILAITIIFAIVKLVSTGEGG